MLDIGRFANAWNAFIQNRDPTITQPFGSVTSINPNRIAMRMTSERSIVASLFNRIAIDVANIKIRHVLTDDQEQYVKTLSGSLNNLLTLEANIDQTHVELFHDIVISMFDEGSVAVVPVVTSKDPMMTDSYDIYELRTAQILDWYPEYVRVRVYNQRTGDKEDITMAKKDVAIIQNPLYSVINEQNSILKRLVRKLNMLDLVDEQNSSGKMDLIIQLPYIIKSEARKKQADERRLAIEEQLTGSKYGIAYTDGTERITQLNRPVTNNLFEQVQYLTKELYSQLGISAEVFEGTASPEQLQNYMNRTITPIVKTVTNEFKRKFLTPTARTQKQSIMYFNDIFGLIPPSEIAELADKLLRNEILSPNEFRPILGFQPSKDKSADELRNRNLNQNNTQQTEQKPIKEEENEEEQK